MSFFHNFKSYKAEATAEFYGLIGPMLSNPRVQRLNQYTQHKKYTRLRHSLDVAYFSFLITKFLHWDSRSVARAGLLHDMFYREDSEPNCWKHMKEHPVEALENARMVCALNEVEEDIILKHMWLVNWTPPKYKEGFVVTFVDKFCAMREWSAGLISGAERQCIVDRVPIPIPAYADISAQNPETA